MKKETCYLLFFFLIFELFYFSTTSYSEKPSEKPIVILRKSHEIGEPVVDVKIEKRKLDTEESIEALGNGEVKPLIYDVNNYDLNKLSAKEKKEKFIAIMLPTILIVKEEIDGKRRKTQEIYKKVKLGKNLSEAEAEFLNKAFSKYKVKNGNFTKLIRRLTPPPTSIVLAQAIIESGWGTSRFFKEANNVFGIWSFDENEPRVPSKFGYRNGERVFLKKYDSLKGCLEDYLYKMAVLPHYERFREELSKTKNSKELTKYLEDYSELRGEYVARLNSLISKNDLDSYEEYTIKR